MNTIEELEAKLDGIEQQLKKMARYVTQIEEMNRQNRVVLLERVRQDRERRARKPWWARSFEKGK